MVPTKLLVVASLPHNSYPSFLFKIVQVDTMGFLGFSFLVELYAWSSEGDVGGQDVL
jgi:hypothetical protein